MRDLRLDECIYARVRRHANGAKPRTDYIIALEEKITRLDVEIEAGFGHLFSAEVLNFVREQGTTSFGHIARFFDCSMDRIKACIHWLAWLGDVDVALVKTRKGTIIRRVTCTHQKLGS